MRIIHVTARIFTYEHNLAVVQAIVAMDESMRKWMDSRAIPLAFEQQGLADVLPCISHHLTLTLWTIHLMNMKQNT